MALTDGGMERDINLEEDYGIIKAGVMDKFAIKSVQVEHIFHRRQRCIYPNPLFMIVVYLTE